MYKLIYDSRENQLGLLDTFKVLFRRRKLFFLLVYFELNSKYKKSVLGVFWSFLNPLLTSSVIYFVFGKIFNAYMPQNRGYATWVVSGVLLQVLLLQGMTNCSAALQGALPMMVKNRVEPGLQVFVSAASQTIHFCIGTLSLIPLALITHQSLSFRILIIPLFLALAILLIAGFGMILVPWFMRYDDAQFLFNAVLMIIGYLTPVFYPIAILSDKIQRVVMFNPFTHWIIVFRWIFFDKQNVTNLNLFIVMGSTIIIFILGIRSLERNWNSMVML